METIPRPVDLRFPVIDDGSSLLYDERRRYETAAKWQIMKIVEELQDIDKRLVEWLTKEGLTQEEREALVEARKELVGVASRMLIAKILDPDDYKMLSETSMKEIAKTLSPK